MKVRSFFSIITVLLGSALEYYDYMLFTMMLPIIAPIFTGLENGLASLKQGYLLIFLSAACRPIGGLLIGYLGDKKGRSVALFWSMIVMASSSFIIGYLPTYAQIGVYAFYLLQVLRTLQTMSAAGELNGAAIFLIESFEGKFKVSRKGFASGLAWCFTVLGMLVASVATYKCDITNWYIPFICGGFVGLFALLLRVMPKENPAAVKTEVSENFNFMRSIIASILIACGISGMFYYNMIFMPGVLQFQMDKVLVREFSMYYFILYSFTLLFSGILYDYFKKGYNLVLFGCVTMAIFALPTLYIMDLRFNMLNVLVLALFVGPSHAVLFKLFPREFRYRGVSTAYSIGTSIIGGITPMICTVLFQKHVYLPSLWLVFVATLGFIGVYIGRADLIHQD